MKKSSLLIGAVLVLTLGSCLATAGALFYFFAPLSPQLENRSFIVTKGDTLARIASKLTEQGLLRSPLGLRILARLSPGTIIIQPGTYKLSPHMGPKEILNVLQSETQDVWVTLKEGLRAEEIADVIAQSLKTSFSATDFSALAVPVEGKLFPDTYLFSKEMTTEAVFSKLVTTFEDRYAKAVAEVGKGGWSKEDTIIVASLVEREGRGEKDSQMIAGIIKNRLEAKMPLQIDATLQYAIGYDREKQTWWSVPKSKDKEVDSPYNTYMHAGLPPTPICNPGLLSLKASLAPTASEYLFYLHDRQGKPHYAKTYEEHQKNIDLYLR